MQQIVASAEEIQEGKRVLEGLLDDIQEVQRKPKRYYDLEFSEQDDFQALVLFEWKNLD
jgi:hypothetical protein